MYCTAIGVTDMNILLIYIAISHTVSAMDYFDNSEVRDE